MIILTKCGIQSLAVPSRVGVAAGYETNPRDGLRRAGRYRCKLHSSFNLPHSSSHIPCTSCMFVNGNTLEAEDLFLANGS